MALPLIGLDIGGTKCALIRAGLDGAIVDVTTFPTAGVDATLEKYYSLISRMDLREPSVFGISCGGPLDTATGLILSPPNLPGWDGIPITAELERRFGGRAFLMNDANAGALAEWQYGAGRGFHNIVFLTSGTGMGAGFILDGRLYEGTSGMAGEVGHMRLAPDGPVGYGKAGSFEGFCSGGGIAQLAQARARELGGAVAFNPGRIGGITTRDVGLAAARGDTEAREVFAAAGRYLGMALAVIVDFLNPQRIIIGSVYARCGAFIAPAMRETLEREALAQSLRDCEIVPAALGEDIGNYAAIAAARYKMGKFDAEGILPQKERTPQ
ncbi:MAG: ROK family protein [bacterium]|nr:ROK family protein [Candidatus Sumerlaeota bacterium]